MQGGINARSWLYLQDLLSLFAEEKWVCCVTTTFSARGYSRNESRATKVPQNVDTIFML
jgi:hypothetical protein